VAHRSSGRSIHDDDFYSPTRPANLFLLQQRARAMLRLLAASRLLPVHGKRILDVGCGGGQQLVDFESWGARRADLAGIDIDESRVQRAQARLTCDSTAGSAGADIRRGDASRLPWPDATFDVVHQSVVFTSIPADAGKRAVAAEMLRVLKPGGTVIWYDFLYNNPKNPSVKGVGAREIRALFPNCAVTLKRVTLAPPVARKLAPRAWMAAMLLEELVVANTHYLGLIRKPADA
jgi:ubiquinone/menaquinone biosynthesis C-methylase UbiE